MFAKQRITTVGGTIACALGIGYFMQHDGQNRYPAPVSKAKPVAQSPLEPAELSDAGTLDLEHVTLTSALPAEQPLPGVFRTASLFPIQLPPLPDKPDLPARSCDIVADAQETAMASAALSISAPCFANERVTIHHNGMMFSDTTDQSGELQVTVPVLAQHAVFIVEFANGNGAVAVTDVTSLNQFDRVALQWSGAGGFQVHAREFGAAYGENGHVWSGSAHLEGAETGLSHSGVVMRLGDADSLVPKLVEVYSFPSGLASKTGKVQLSVEAEVTEANCGRKFDAQTLELRTGDGLHTRNMVLAMPDCSATGDFLVLNNLVDDLMIASK